MSGIHQDKENFMAVEKPAATVIAENLGVQVADLNGDGRIDVVGDGRMEVGYGPTVTIPRSPRLAPAEAESGDTSAPQIQRRADGVVQGGEFRIRGRAARYEKVETRYLNVDGHAVVGANVDRRTVVAREGIVATFPVARYFGPDGARALIGKREDHVAAFARAVGQYNKTRFAGHATHAVEAAQKGGFLTSVSPEVKGAARSALGQNVAAAIRQLRGNQGPVQSNMRLYEGAMSTLALLDQDPNNPVVGDGKTSIAEGRNADHQEMQALLLKKGMKPADVLAFVQRVANATGSDVPLTAPLQTEGNKTVAPK